MKKILMTLVLVLCITFLFGCENASFDEEKGVIVIGMECGYAPFNWTETKQTASNVKINNSSLFVQGYDVQIAKLIAEDLGYELVIEMIEFDGLVMALKAGKIDAIIAGMSPTLERKESIDFTDSYYISQHVILLKSDSPYIEAKHFSDFNNATVMGQASTLYDKLAKQLKEKNASIIYKNPLDTVPEIVNAINSKMVDLTIVEEPVAKQIVRSNATFTYITLEDNFEVEDSDIEVSIGVRKTDSSLREKINTALSNISQDTRNNLMDNAINSSGE